MYKQNEKQWKDVFHNVKLTDQLLFQLNVQKVDQLTESKWLICDTKHHKENQL